MFLGYVSHNYFNISPCGAPRLRNHTGNSSFHVGPPPTVRYSVPAPSMTSTLKGQERRWTVNFTLNLRNYCCLWLICSIQSPPENLVEIDH